MTAVLSLTGITKTFPGVRATHDVSLEVAAGEIHGLLGENGAGKSTLMNIVTGLLHPDSGTIAIRGRPVHLRSPLDARRLGIGMVHQHFMLVPTMTVAENVALGARSTGLPLARLGAVSARIREVSTRYGLQVDPAARVSELSVGERQRVEIVRLLFAGADLLIFDEPTGVLTPQEWREVAQIMLQLAGEGKALIFITHKLDELFEVAHRCTVMRDGEVVGTVDVGETDKRTLARMMVGRDVVLRVERPRVTPGGTVLIVEGLGVVDEDGRQRLDGITFEIRQSEILGVAGVDGNGQQELIEVLTGLRKPTAGRIAIHGEEVSRLDPQRFMALGGSVIHADRHHSGVALDLSLEENLVMSEYRGQRFSRHGVLRLETVRRHSAELLRRYDVRAPGPSVLMGQLSGGNQQKVVLAREMEREPSLLLASQPTRGLDVGAVEFVYEQLARHKLAGGATLLISTELDEILTLSDRITVLSGGRLLRTFAADEADTETLGLLMAGEDGVHP